MGGAADPVTTSDGSSEGTTGDSSSGDPTGGPGADEREMLHAPDGDWTKAHTEMFIEYLS